MAKAKSANRVFPVYDHWEHLSDDEFQKAMTDFREFCRQSIVLDEDGRPVTFVLNEAQEMFAEKILEAIVPIMKKDPCPSIKILCHKSRQMGITTVSLKLEQFVLSKVTHFNALHVMPTEDEADELKDRKLMPLLQGTHPDLMPTMIPVSNYVDFTYFEGNLLDNRLTYMSAGAKGAGHGRYNFYNEYIITYNKGEITWGQVEVGDILFDRYGNKTTVTETFHHKDKHRYRLHLKDGRTIDSGAEHLWLVAAQKKTAEQKEETAFTANTQWLLDNGADKYSIPNNGCLDLPERALDIDPYLMGVLLGDGHILDSGVVRVKSMYKPHPELLGDPNWDPKESRWDKATSSYKDAIIKYGLNGKHADNKFIPRDYLMNSEANRRALLAGLMDTDGCAGYKTRYSTVSEQLAKDVRWLVRSLGGHSQMNLQTKVRKNELPYYTVSVALPFNPFRRPEKASRYNPVRIPKWSRIDRIEMLPERSDAMCVMVDAPTHTYIIGEDFIVTHNTIHMLVEDEHAKYIDPFSFEAGVIPAMRGNTVRIVIFTAKGMNHSYDLSEAAQDPESDWVYIFLPWYILSDYEVEPYGRFKTLEGLTDYDMFLFKEFKRAGIPKEKWLRKAAWYNKIFINDAHRDWKYMYENYPTVAEESFKASGSAIFDSGYLREWQTLKYKQVDIFYRDGETIFEYVDSGVVREREAPIRNHSYIIGADMADGEVDGDDSALVVWDVSGGKIQAVAAYNGLISQNNFADLVYDVATRYNDALVVPERNTGQLMIKWLVEIKGYSNVWTDQKKVSGYNNLGVYTTVPVKNEAIARLKFLINNGYYEDFDPVFCNQAQYFVYEKTPSGMLRAAAAAGYKDDAVMARLMAVMAIDMEQFGDYNEQLVKDGRKY